MSEYLPKSWVTAPVSELVTLTKGKKPASVGSPDSCMTTPYVTIKVFETGVASDYCSPDGLPLCTEDDVLIVWDGARCGLTGRGVSGAIGSTLARMDVPEISRPYLHYFMQSQFHRLNSNPRGVGIPHVDPNVFSSIPFPLPPLAEQRRIVDEIEKQLTRLDAAVEALRAAQVKLKRYRASVLNAAVTGRLVPTEAALARAEGRDYEHASVLLERIERERQAEQKGNRSRRKRPAPVDTSNLPELPEGWAWTTLSSIGQVRLGRQRSPNRAVGPNMHPYLRAANVGWNGLNLADVKEMDFTPNEYQNYQLLPGDILLSEASGSADEVGKPAIWNGEIDSCCFQNTLIRVRMDPNLVSYVYHHLLSDARSGALGRAARGVGIHHLGAERTEAWAVSLPPLAEQRRIVAEIERRLSTIQQAETTIEANLKRAERLRQAILKRAFEGRLVPQDPDDEPAAVLLERIKTERATQQHPRRGQGVASRRLL